MKFDINKRDIYWDIAKGIAALCVVTQHFMSEDVLKQGGSVLFSVLQYLHMPTFFFISGYFGKRALDSMSFAELALCKAKRLLIPYFMWTLVAVSAHYIGPILNNSFSFNNFMRDLVVSLLYGKSVWYFIALFEVFLLVKVLIIFRKKNELISIFLIIFILVIPVKIETFLIYKIQELFLFFILGVVCYSHETIINKLKRFRFYFILIIPVSLFCMNKLYHVSDENWFIYIVAQLLGDIIGFLFTSLILTSIVHAEKHIGNFFALVGQYSMEVYCIHMVIINYLVLATPSVVLFYINSLGIFYYLICSSIIAVLCVIVSKYFFNKIYLYRCLMLGRK